jgi:type IV secretory pathway VirB10-like protein
MNAPQPDAARPAPAPAPAAAPAANAAAAPSKPDEKSAQHGKRAVMVAAALCCLVVGGLLVDSLLSARKPPEEPPPEEVKARTERDPFDDFEAKQRAELARLENERRKRNVVAQTEAASVAASAAALTPEQELYRAARLEDLKRALAAVQSPGMITTGSPAGATVRTAQAGPRAAAPTGDMAGASGAGGESRSEATLAKLRQAVERARGGGGGGAMPTGFSRDLHGAQASSAVVGQSASARRGAGERMAREGEYLLPVGSVLSGVLDMEISSDWEGRWRAMLLRDVYDVTQTVILLPKGTRILGTTARAKPVNEAINERMALAANWLVLPNGARIDLSRSGTLDAAGIGGIEGDVNRHFLATLGGVVAYGVIGGLGAAAAVNGIDGQIDPGAISLGRTAGAEIAAGLVGIGQRVASRYLNLVPTINIQPGTPITIFLDDEMYLSPWAPVDEVLPANLATTRTARR